MKFGELIKYLDEVFPKNLSASWDSDGVEVCVDYNLEIGRILTVLDITFDVVDFAVANGYNCILSHHALFFKPVKKIDLSDSATKKAVRMIKHGICAASFHTRLDSVDGGVNDCFLKALNINENSKIEQFYEPGETASVGRIVELEEECDLIDFIEDIKKAFKRYYKTELDIDQNAGISYIKGDRDVKKIGAVSGGGMDFAEIAAKMGADTFITGEGKYNRTLEAYESLDKGSRLNIITMGHFETEIVVLPFMKHKILEKFPNAVVDCFTGEYNNLM